VRERERERETDRQRERERERERENISNQFFISAVLDNSRRYRRLGIVLRKSATLADGESGWAVLAETTSKKPYPS
jgi:hypothetical protein